MNAKEAMEALLAGKALYHGPMEDPKNTTRIALKDGDLWIWSRYNRYRGGRLDNDPFNGDLKEYDPSTPFCPCPVCGRALRMDDMVFCDDEGPMTEVSDAHNGDGTFDRVMLESAGWADALGCVENVGILCSCGFAFWTPMDGIRMEDDPTWLTEFKEKANRRSGI